MKILLRELQFAPQGTHFTHEAKAVDLKTKREIAMYGRNEVEALQALDSTLERWSQALDKGRDEVQKYIDEIKAER